MKRGSWFDKLTMSGGKAHHERSPAAYSTPLILSLSKGERSPDDGGCDVSTGAIGTGKWTIAIYAFSRVLKESSRSSNPPWALQLRQSVAISGDR